MVERVDQFINKSTRHCILALQFFTEVTTDMQPTSGVNMSRFRRTALCYRDAALPQIFERGLNMLKRISAAEANIADISVTACLFRRDPGAEASRAA